MQKSTRNALSIVHNPAQGSAQKVLCVCSAGLLRSPTLANYLHTTYGYNTRSCGVSEYTLIPLLQALVSWADKIVFVQQDVYNLARLLIPTTMPEWAEMMEQKSICLDIEDDFDYDSAGLKQVIREQLTPKEIK